MLIKYSSGKQVCDSSRVSPLNGSRGQSDANKKYEIGGLYTPSLLLLSFLRGLCISFMFLNVVAVR